MTQINIGFARKNPRIQQTGDLAKMEITNKQWEHMETYGYNNTK